MSIHDIEGFDEASAFDEKDMAILRARQQAAGQKARADNLYDQLQESREAVRQLTQRAETREVYTGLAAQVWAIEKSAAALHRESNEQRKIANEHGLTILDFARLCGWTHANPGAGPAAAVYRKLGDFRSMERGRSKEAARLRAEVAALTESEGKALTHAEQMEKELEAARCELGRQHSEYAREINRLTTRIHEVAKERNDARAQLTIKTQEFQNELHALTKETERLRTEKTWSESPLKAERDELQRQLTQARAWIERWRPDLDGCAAALLTGQPAEPGSLTEAAQRLSRLADEKREDEQIFMLRQAYIQAQAIAQSLRSNNQIVLEQRNHANKVRLEQLAELQKLRRDLATITARDLAREQEAVKACQDLREERDRIRQDFAKFRDEMDTREKQHWVEHNRVAKERDEFRDEARKLRTDLVLLAEMDAPS